MARSSKVICLRLFTLFASVLFLLAAAFTACISRNSVDSNDSGLNSPKKKTKVTAIDFTSYLDSCARAFGIDKASFPKFNCSQGGQVVTTQNGIPINPNKFSPGMRCDNPSLIANSEEGCRPHSWVGQTTSDSVVWSYLCRQFSPTNAGDGSADIVGVIAYHQTTGSTCFFESKQAKTGTKLKELPKLQDDPNAVFWKTPTELAMDKSSLCVTCHSGNPWIQSLFFKQVPNHVPQNKFDLSKKNETIAYNVVEFESMELISGAGTWTPFRLAASEAPSCVACHSIGKGDFCRSYAPFSFGQLEATEHAALSQKWPTQNLHDSFFGANTKKYPTEVEFLNSRLAKDLSAVQACCKGNKCNWLTNSSVGFVK